MKKIPILQIMIKIAINTKKLFYIFGKSQKKKKKKKEKKKKEPNIMKIVKQKQFIMLKKCHPRFKNIINIHINK